MDRWNVLPVIKKKKFILAALGLSCGMQDLFPWPGIKPKPLALGVQNLSYCTTREVPVIFYKSNFIYKNVSVLMTTCLGWMTQQWAKGISFIDSEDIKGLFSKRFVQIFSFFWLVLWWEYLIGFMMGESVYILNLKLSVSVINTNISTAYTHGKTKSSTLKKLFTCNFKISLKCGAPE